jgi:hypothetical protein
LEFPGQTGSVFGSGLSGPGDRTPGDIFRIYNITYEIKIIKKILTGGKK